MNHLLNLETTKGQIVYCLCNEWPLTAKRIHQHVKRDFRHTLSYQAIHKTLQDLTREETIESSPDGYLISPKWVEQSEQFLKTVKESYQKGKFNQVQQQDHQTLTFHSIVDLGRYLIFDFLQHDTGSERIGVAHWQHMYYLAGLSKEEVESIRENMQKNQWIVLCRSKSPFNQMLANSYEKMGGKVIFTSQLASKDFDLWVWGDLIAQIYYPQDVKDHWYTPFSKVKEVDKIDFEAYLNAMHRKTNPITVHVFKDEKLSQQYQKQAQKLIQKEENKK